jgi:hypothetical protein
MKRASLEQLYSGRQVLEIPLYSVFEVSRYLQTPETTLRAWVAGRTYPLRSGGWTASRGHHGPADRIRPARVEVVSGTHGGYRGRLQGRRVDR